MSPAERAHMSEASGIPRKVLPGVTIKPSVGNSKTQVRVLESRLSLISALDVWGYSYHVCLAQKGLQFIIIRRPSQRYIHVPYKDLWTFSVQFSTNICGTSLTYSIKRHRPLAKQTTGYPLRDLASCSLYHCLWTLGFLPDSWAVSGNTVWPLPCVDLFHLSSKR